MYILYTLPCRISTYIQTCTVIFYPWSSEVLICTSSFKENNKFEEKLDIMLVLKELLYIKLKTSATLKPEIRSTASTGKKLPI